MNTLTIVISPRMNNKSIAEISVYVNTEHKTDKHFLIHPQANPSSYREILCQLGITLDSLIEPPKEILK